MSEYGRCKLWFNFNFHVFSLLKVKLMAAAALCRGGPVADVRCRPAGYPARYEFAWVVMRGIAGRHLFNERCSCRAVDHSAQRLNLKRRAAL
jgi:hypothetical protein